MYFWPLFWVTPEKTYSISMHGHNTRYYLPLILITAATLLFCVSILPP